MKLLELLESLGEMPAEVWLIPPVVILALMAAIGWLRRSWLLRDYRAIAARTGLSVAPKILNASEIRGAFRGRKLAMLAGASEVVVGDAEFDRRFVIQSRDEKAIAKMFAGNHELRALLLRSKVDSVHVLGTTLHVHYARSERDPSHAELLFTAATSLADAIDAVQPDDTPEIIRTR